MTGSKRNKLDESRFLFLQTQYEYTYELIQKSKEVEESSDVSLRLLSFLDHLGKNKNIRPILHIEALSLQWWLDYRSFSHNDGASIRSGLLQCHAAIDMLDVMETNPSLYRGVATRFFSMPRTKRTACRWTPSENSSKANTCGCKT
ncbi:MAG: hypothetical protein LBP92_11340 [Deltaproteobacteria bacterium]|nr:hypothetical protein [Deltaproteobacteria bacterium]